MFDVIVTFLMET